MEEEGYTVTFHNKIDLDEHLQKDIIELSEQNSNSNYRLALEIIPPWRERTNILLYMTEKLGYFIAALIAAVFLFVASVFRHIMHIRKFYSLLEHDEKHTLTDDYGSGLFMSLITKIGLQK